MDTDVSDTEETSAGETGGREARDVAADLDGAELLAVARAHHDSYVQSHSHHGAFACCSAHASADTVPELLAEVERLRVENAHLRDELDRQEFNLRMKWGQELGDRLNEIAPDVMKEAALRAETAERALGEMRERMHADSPEATMNVEWGVQWLNEDGTPYGRYWPGKTEAMQTVINNHANGAGNAQLLCRFVGEPSVAEVELVRGEWEVAADA